ncbi:MAG: hypothetical protein K6E29_05880 [Cyanobacteria bacterium RUI128]|nr:hypothetical protein [Cyanobacteria bacterium RUI128]
MTEINKKPEINIAQPVAKNIQPEVKAENKKTEDISKEYKEAAAAPGAEAAGRAMVMLNKAKKTDADNIENDIQKIIANPKLVNQSDALFSAAEKAGYSYPVAASFATSELG